LIDVSRTFEDLVEIWPAAGRLRESICGTNSSLVSINEDTIARLRNDPAAMVEEAA
jgi:hypothetical protein